LSRGLAAECGGGPSESTIDDIVDVVEDVDIGKVRKWEKCRHQKMTRFSS
jgi:hypothetical protein